MRKYTPINGWTKEKMIAQIEKHLPADGSRCMSIVKQNGTVTEKGCAYYRKSDNSRCAIGAFLPGVPNDESARWFDFSCPVGHLLERAPHLHKFMPLDFHILGTLQRVHDKAGTVNVKAEVIAWIEENVE